MSQFSGITDILESINEETTSANVAFLPGGFSTVSKSIQDLAKMKNSWDIEVLESADGYDVDFEGQLKVNVKKDHWPEFLSHTKDSLGDFSKIRKISGASLDHFLQEAVVDEIENLLCELKESLLNRLKKSEVRNASICASYWESVIKPSRIIKDQRAAIGYKTMSEDVDNVVNKAKKEYAGDIGGLQELIYKVNESKSLAGVSLFKGLPLLFSVIMESGRKNGKVIFEAAVDMRGVKFINVITQDKDLLERLAELPGMRVFGMRRMISPKGGIFSKHDVEVISEAINQEDTK